MAFSNIPKGQYTITASKSGYYEATKNQYISGDITTSITLTKIPTGTPTYTLTAYCKAPSGMAVPPSEIECAGVIKKLNVDFTALAAFAGVQFTGLENGNYQIYAKGPFMRGYATATISGSDTSVTINFQMHHTLSIASTFNLNITPHDITPYYQDATHYLGKR